MGSIVFVFLDVPRAYQASKNGIEEVMANQYFFSVKKIVLNYIATIMRSSEWLEFFHSVLFTIEM